jgi:hypothetical protein
LEAASKSDAKLGSVSDTQCQSSLPEAFIFCPQGYSGHPGSGQQVQIDKADNDTAQAMGVDEKEIRFKGYRLDGGKRLKQGENFGTVFQVAAGQFPNDKWMDPHAAFRKQVFKLPNTASNVLLSYQL